MCIRQRVNMSTSCHLCGAQIKYMNSHLRNKHHWSKEQVKTYTRQLKLDARQRWKVTFDVEDIIKECFTNFRAGLRHNFLDMEHNSVLSIQTMVQETKMDGLRAMIEEILTPSFHRLMLQMNAEETFVQGELKRFVHMN